MAGTDKKEGPYRNRYREKRRKKSLKSKLGAWKKEPKEKSNRRRNWRSFDGLKRSTDADNRYKNLDNDPRGPWQSDNFIMGRR